jgi:prephenate dehydrogenase
MFIHRLALIGVGLIGGSLARALKKTNSCDRIIGCSHHAAELEKALALGVIDGFHTEPGRAVADADVVIIATPVGAMGEVFAEIAGYLSSTAVVSDVGSVKGAVVAEARQRLGRHFPNFVPGHPIAGTEKSGVENSFAELFAGRRVILTPTAETNAEAVQVIARMWEAAGAEVELMEVDRHDEILAATSHLPHLLAFTLVEKLASMRGELGDMFRFAGGGFDDFSRIAASNPAMWRDIVFANRESILASLESFGQGLDRLAEAIRAGDQTAVFDLFTRAKQARDEYTMSRNYPPRQPNEDT